nr:hypothetical protein ABEDB_3534 [Acinetobacter lwoffii]
MLETIENFFKTIEIFAANDSETFIAIYLTFSAAMCCVGVLWLHLLTKNDNN